MRYDWRLGALLALALLIGSPLRAQDQSWVASDRHIFPVDAHGHTFSGNRNTVIYNDGYSRAWETSNRNEALDALDDRIAATDTRGNYPDIHSLNGVFNSERDWDYADRGGIRTNTLESFNDTLTAFPGMQAPPSDAFDGRTRIDGSFPIGADDPFAEAVVDRFGDDLQGVSFERERPWDMRPIGWWGGEETKEATGRFTEQARNTLWGSVVGELQAPRPLSSHDTRESARDYYDGYQDGMVWAERQGRGEFGVPDPAREEMARYQGALQAPGLFGEGMVSVRQAGGAVAGGGRVGPAGQTDAGGVPAGY